MNKSRLKITTFYFAMFCLAFLFCFVITEYVVAPFYVEVTNNNLFSPFEFDPLLGWKPKPNTYQFKPPYAFKSLDIYINKLGLRNRDIAEHKNKGAKRIIILGDSFTFGSEVSSEYLFTSQLEYILNKNMPGKYEIINAGVSAYGTSQELLLMKYLADNNVAGDIYLLIMFTNDIMDNLRIDYENLNVMPHRPGFILKNDGHLELKYLPQRPSSVNKEVAWDKEVKPAAGKTKIKADFKTITLIKNRVGTLLQTKPAIIKFLYKFGLDIEMPRFPALLNSWYREDILDQGVPLMRALINELKNEAMQKNAQLLIAHVPSQIQVYPEVFQPILKKTYPDNKLVSEWLKDPLRPQRTIEEICKELDIPFLDLYPELLKNNSKSLFIHGDGHFNESGHTLTAHSLARFINENAQKAP